MKMIYLFVKFDLNLNIWWITRDIYARNQRGVAGASALIATGASTTGTDSRAAAGAASTATSAAPDASWATFYASLIPIALKSFNSFYDVYGPSALEEDEVY